MDLSCYSIKELVTLYSQIIKELRERGVLRTKNFMGELGTHLVLEHYNRIPNLPKLTLLPVGTKNMNAIDQNGERYVIKSTSGNVTGVFYGLQPPTSPEKDKQIFEYVIICKFDDNCDLEGIYQISWNQFQVYKKWHSRMNAWNVTLSNALKEDALVIYTRNFSQNNVKLDDGNEYSPCNIDASYSTGETQGIHVEVSEETQVVTWTKTGKLDHSLIREKVAENLKKRYNKNFQQQSLSRYVSVDNEAALYILSASYSKKNKEYWYSINDENIPWMEIYPTCYIAFALGDANNVLLFSFDELYSFLGSCLRTEANPSKNKQAHYHFSFAVEGSRVFFKKKLPKNEKGLIEVTKNLM